MYATATSAAIDTCTSPRLAALACASASLAFSALRLPPKMSGSQLASKPVLNELLVRVSLPAELLRCADADAPIERRELRGAHVAQRARLAQGRLRAAHVGVGLQRVA